MTVYKKDAPSVVQFRVIDIVYSKRYKYTKLIDKRKRKGTVGHLVNSAFDTMISLHHCGTGINYTTTLYIQLRIDQIQMPEKFF